MRLLLPFVILPIVEIALFIQVGGAIGVLPTIALVLLSSVLGVAVMRRQGQVAALDMQRAMQEFRNPAQPMAQGALVMVAGLLLVVPGLFTTALGLLLLVPGMRSLILRRMGRRIKAGTVQYSYRREGGPEFMDDVPPGYHRARSSGDEGVIDGEYSVQDDPPAPVREGLTDGRDESPRRGNSGWTRH
ncbi:MAG: FxsA family protein [Paracoccus sp. (in: a-proteobacteria)]|uniref:FxsA family protein n=1 Tax=Paracoccus sp. TaxID=267 RepID=UPI0039E3AE94